MKTESTAMYVIRLAATLLIITAVVAVALAAVNAVTAPAIEALSIKKTQEAIEEVLDGGGEEMTSFPATDLVSKVYKGENGYAVEVKPIGFDNAITMMVGVDNEGKVLKIAIISHTETAGLGAVAAAGTPAGEAFRAQFAGTSGEVKVTKDGGEIDSITGATITSRAVSLGVTAALNCVAAMG